MSGRDWRQPVTMAEALSAALQRLGLEGRLRQHDLWRVWSTIVGPQIARQAQPHSFRHGRLVIHVTDPIWLHHLSMMRHKLVAALNAQLAPAQIREISLRVGEVPETPVGPSPTPPHGEPEREVDPSRVAEIDGALAVLGDAPCRESLRRLWLRASREPGTVPRNREASRAK
jgi:hypothetical protein